MQADRASHLFSAISSPNVDSDVADGESIAARVRIVAPQETTIAQDSMTDHSLRGAVPAARFQELEGANHMGNIDLQIVRHDRHGRRACWVWLARDGMRGSVRVEVMRRSAECTGRRNS